MNLVIFGLAAIAGTALASILMLSYGFNSIYASSLGMVLVALAIILMRRDLMINSFLSGTLLFVSFFFEYMIMLRIYPELFDRWWFLENLSGIEAADVPIEELLWAVALGMLLGPMYEFLSGRNIEPLKA